MKPKVTTPLFAVFFAIVVLGFALAVVPALAQNAVPPVRGGSTDPPPPPPSCFFMNEIIHDFSGPDGSGPNGVAMDKAGNLYGTTSGGGDYGLGTAFRAAPKGQDWLFTTLYSFTEDNYWNGSSPLIIGPDGALYGTAGGGSESCGGHGCGLVFRLTPPAIACRNSPCSWNETVLYRFGGTHLDGWQPNGHLVLDHAGNLYGTTESGGAYGYGAIYELTPSPAGWRENVLYSFPNGYHVYGTGCSGVSACPSALLMGNDGNMYGASKFGGAGGYSQVFQLVPSGDGWTEQDISYLYGQYKVIQPNNLVQDSAGNLYGTALTVYSPPVVFLLSHSDGGWTLSVVDQLAGDLGDISASIEGLTIDAADNLYYSVHGDQGGAYDWRWGAVLEWSIPNNDGTLLWLQDYNILFPLSGPLAVDTRGNVYGTTSTCGKYGQGAIWEVLNY